MTLLPSSHRGLEAHFFVWMFAVVAGTLLLLFFIRLSFQHIDTENLLEDRTILFDLEQQLHALSTSESVSKILSFRQPISLRFACDSLIGTTSQRTTQDFIFAPAHLGGNALSLWTQPWEYPFPIASFFYLLDKQTKIIIVYDAASASFIEDISFPPSFGVTLLHIQDFDPQKLADSLSSFSTVHLVFLADYRAIARLFDFFSSSSLHVVLVDLAQQQLTLIDQQSQVSLDYFGNSMLLGAFFAPQSFACLRERAITRFFALTTLYEQKAGLLAGKLATRPSCQAPLLQAQTFLRQTPATADHIPALAASFSAINQQLLSYDCPTLF